MLKRLIIPLAAFFCAVSTPASAAGDTLIAGNKGEDSVSFIDLETGRTLAKLWAGKAPHEIAVSPDGRLAVAVAYGGMVGGRKLYVYDVETAKHLKTIDLGEHSRPHGITWLGDGQKVAVTTEGSHQLLIVDVAEGKIEAAVGTRQRTPHMVALSPDRRRAFVAGIRSGTVVAIDLTTQRWLGYLESDRGTEGIAVTPNGREIWAANRGANNVVVFNSANFERMAVIDTGQVPIRVAVCRRGAHAVTTDWKDGALSVIDIASKRVVKTVPLSVDSGPVRPVSLLFHPTKDLLYVSIPSASEIAVIDSQNWQQIGLIRAGEGVDGLGYSVLQVRSEGGPFN